MKIGLFTDTFAPQINGVVTVVQMMVRQFEALGHEPVVFAPAYPNQPQDESNKVWRFPSRKVHFHPESRLTWPYRRKVPTVLSELDVVHSHTPFSLGLLAIWTAHHYRVPHVHTYHTYFSEYRHYIPRPIRPPKRMAEGISRAFCDRCQWVLAPSEEMKEELDRYGIRTPVEAMPFGIDLDAFQRPLKFDLRAELHLSPPTKLLLSAGRLGPEKNFAFVIEAFARIKRTHDDAALVIVGDGPSRQGLEQQAEALGLQADVHFLGYIDRAKLIDSYRQADLFVFASKTETQGIVLLEAQAAGTPVVAIGEMGVCDVVESGRGGLLVPEDLEAFAAAVLSLLTDPERRSAFAQNALDMARRHSARTSCQALLACYEKLLKRDAVLSS